MTERLVVDRFNNHAKAYHLLPAKQSTYRQYHCAETVITIVHNDIVRDIDAENVSVLVLLDLSAAFDTVDHDMLLDVLRKRFGVVSKAFDWCKSYLSERTQSFCVVSEHQTRWVLHVVFHKAQWLGQWSSLPTLKTLVKQLIFFRINHHLYADDTQLQDHMHIDTIQANRLNLELCIDAIKDWCASRRLQLNGDKTEIIWFGLRANVNKLSSVDTTLRIASTIVEPVNSVRNLSVYMDSALSMRTHIDKVSIACFYHLRCLRQLRYVVSKIYNAAACLISGASPNRLL